MASKAAAAHLTLVVRRNLDWTGPPEEGGDASGDGTKGKAAAAEQALPPSPTEAAYASRAARRARYMQRVLGEEGAGRCRQHRCFSARLPQPGCKALLLFPQKPCLIKHFLLLPPFPAADATFNILFDSRRKTCHCLALAYFVACGGLASFVREFGVALQLLRELPPAKAAGSGSSGSNAAMPEAGEGSEGPSGSGASGSGIEPPAANLSTQVAETQRGAIEGLANTFLVLMNNMGHAPMIINSPNAGALLCAPVPGTGGRSGEELRAAPDLQTFIRKASGAGVAVCSPRSLLLCKHAAPLSNKIAGVGRAAGCGAAAVARACAGRTPPAPGAEPGHGTAQLH